MATDAIEPNILGEQSEARDAAVGVLARIVLPMFVVLAAFLAIVVLPERLSLTKLAALPAGLGFLIVSVKLRILPYTLMAAFVFALTYARNYYLLGRTGECQGLYWIPADVPLLALASVWTFQTVRIHQWSRHGIGRLWLWMLPLLGLGIVSVFTSDRTDWVLYDLTRILRGLFIVIVLSLLMDSKAWWSAVIGLGIAVFVQSTYGMAQVALKRSSYILEGESIVRAAGTMMHPNLMAGFLLLAVPLFLALGVGSNRGWIRWASLAVGIAGFGGVVATMSRIPCALAVAQVLLIGVVLIAMRKNRAEQWIGLGALIVIAVSLAAIPFSKKIYERLTGNLQESVEFRTKVNRFAFQTFLDEPLTGVGLNHFTKHMLRISPAYRVLYRDNVEDAKAINVRYMLAVHNAYLLVLAELGAPGLVAFVGLLFAILVMGIRAFRRTQGAVQVACIGMVVGLLGMYIQGFSEYAMVIEQDFYPLLVVGVLLHFAPRVFPRKPARTSAEGTTLGVNGSNGPNDLHRLYA